MTFVVHVGDAVEVLRTLPAESVHCVVTSPPYWGLRDYGVAGQMGLEPTIGAYLSALVSVFSEVRRVLRADGSIWVNIGDSYVTHRNGGIGGSSSINGERTQLAARAGSRARAKTRTSTGNLKYKDLIGMPWRLAFALQDDGWFLRSDTIWHKPNPMPESIPDRPTKSHEYLFLLSKSRTYYWDREGVMDPVAGSARPRYACTGWAHEGGHNVLEHNRSREARARDLVKAKNVDGALKHLVSQRNMRSVITCPTQASRSEHFATFPEALVRKPIIASCPVDGTVLDPFSGMATTGVVAIAHHRNYIGIELNPAYAAQSLKRLAAADPIGRQQSIEGVA